jgi:phosphoribosylformylglycinamidine synthase
MANVKTLVLTGYGLNCDHETAYAFELAGAVAHRVHINSLIDGSVTLEDYQIMAFIGGFSWADDHGAGVVEALRIKTNIGHKILEFVAKENLIIGICNGFQALVNLGLLPGFDDDYQTRSLALTYNDRGNFINDWVTLKVNPASPCIFTRNLDQFDLPVRHGEGKFFADQPVLDRLIQDDQVVLQYGLPDGAPAGGRFPFNPNGSLYDVAGICDPSGRIFGLMPHPEAYNHFTNHPAWSRRKERLKRLKQTFEKGPTVGVRIFQNAVTYFQ